jgi:D-alanyl-D-alanine carboxypeptidase/D-alanyl-D-alanine-endopeptidase (penicillin-binding protein 4)
MVRGALLVALLALPPATIAAQPASPAPGISPVPFTAAAQPWTAASIGALRHDVDLELRAAALHGAHVGLLAVDTASGTVLYDHNADDDFTPASTLKLFTGVTALERLGRDFRFHTAVLASAAPVDGVVNGDLILRGGGDPLLRRADLQTAAATVASAGVKSITGSLIVDASYFDNEPFREGWAWDDLTEYYAVAPSALTLGESNNSATIVAPATNNAPYGESVSPDPAIRAGLVLRDALGAQGITIATSPVSGLTPAGATVLWQHDGEPLSALLADFWYPSDNLVGETLVKSIGIAHSGVPGKTAAGIAVELDYLKSIGINTATVVIVDGSGLSRYNAVTPRALVQVLLHEWASPNRDIVTGALPVAGVRGDLRKRFIGTTASRRVYAKTGSMTNVTNMAGFVATKSRGTVAFAFLMDDALGDDDGIAATRARIFARMIGE